MSKTRIKLKGGAFAPKDNTEKQPNKDVNEAQEVVEINTIDYFLQKDRADFTEQDIYDFKEVYQKYLRDVYEKTQKINEKLFSFCSAKDLKKNKENGNTNTQIQEKSIRIVLPEKFRELNRLAEEVKNDYGEKGTSFLKILNTSLLELDIALTNPPVSIDSFYNMMSKMLENLQAYNLPQQKYFYRTIADAVNPFFADHFFVSPEDGHFVDINLHKIVEGKGQRIERGLSYILLDKNSNQVIKFGKVKTI
ncbi:hypothetical protein [Tenacibaculum xiamenense]|uniref:hypothetical protein n=1 Tax=Tenacibaculum xiamenense TaxID=1261553 RepID=UPI003893FBBB